MDCPDTIDVLQVYRDSHVEITMPLCTIYNKRACRLTILGRYSTKCVRKELFCDGRINCAWPYSEPAGVLFLTCSIVHHFSAFPFIFISPDELSHVCVFFFHLSFSRWGVLPWDERAWSWVLVDVWPSCDSSSCPSPPCHPRWAWLCPSQVSSLSQSHLQNNYISYTSSLLSSPLYRLNIIIFIPLFKILSFSFVFFLHKFIFYHHRFFSYISSWYFR